MKTQIEVFGQVLDSVFNNDVSRRTIREQIEQVYDLKEKLLTRACTKDEYEVDLRELFDLIEALYSDSLRMK